MGSCFSKPTAANTPSLVTRDATSQERPSPEQSSPVRPHGVGAPRSSSQEQSGTQPRETPKVRGVPLNGRRPRVQSTPYIAPPRKDVRSPPLQRQRTRAKSSVLASSSSRGPSSDYIQTSAGEWDHGKARVPSLTMIRPLEDFS